MAGIVVRRTESLQLAYVPAIHVLFAERKKTWMPGTRPGMTKMIYSSFPIATAVSPMRLEKPHSLSYQASTRTSVPF
jgi:hypothetical protein